MLSTFLVSSFSNVDLYSNTIPNTLTIPPGDTFDLSKPENRAIRPCRAIFDYPQGIAIGAGASKMDQVGLTNAVKEVKLYRNMFCRRPLKEFHNITIDDVKQICYWHHNSDIKHTEPIAGSNI